MKSPTLQVLVVLASLAAGSAAAATRNVVTLPTNPVPPPSTYCGAVPVCIIPVIKR